MCERGAVGGGSADAGEYGAARAWGNGGGTLSRVRQGAPDGSEIASPRAIHPVHPLQTEEAPVAKCEVCGNDYHLAFEVVAAGQHHVFDSFECAIHRMAPVCSHCGCKIIGHGIEANGTFYCCANCARHEGATEAADHV
jgi:hypothetical protein